MAEKRTVRFVKWLIKVVISYAVFIGIGWLLGRIPAERIGLSEDMFFDLRMFFMLFGPIYLSLIVKIVLTILAAIKHKENDTAEQNRGVLLAVTAILMLANLSNAQTAADLSSGLIESKGLKSLNRSKRYNLKGKRFLNIFLPIAFYMLILEILTLLVCIVTFAPLSNAASNAFTSPTIRINGEDMPQAVVKSRFLKLDSSHIEYVLHAMDENPSDIRNIRAYLLTALYNASLTMDNYYAALVNHDLYGQPKVDKKQGL